MLCPTPTPLKLTVVDFNRPEHVINNRSPLPLYSSVSLLVDILSFSLDVGLADLISFARYSTFSWRRRFKDSEASRWNSTWLAFLDRHLDINDMFSVAYEIQIQFFWMQPLTNFHLFIIALLVRDIFRMSFKYVYQVLYFFDLHFKYPLLSKLFFNNLQTA